MKKIFFLLLLFSSILANAQYTYQIVARNLTAPDNTTNANIIGSGAAFHNLTWNVSGTVSSCSVRIDSSTDGITWGTGDIVGATTCTSNGNTISTSHVVNYVRINLVTLTGAGATFTANVSGYITQPTAGGTVTSVTCGTGLSGGTITSTGTCALANTAVTPASYTNANITVDQQGRITAASNGSSGASALNQVETHTVAAASDVQFLTGVTSTYKNYQLIFRLVPGTNAVSMQMQFSSDGGATWIADSHYSSVAVRFNTGGVAAASVSNANQFRIDSDPGSATVDNTSTDGVFGNYLLSNLQSTTLNKKATGLATDLVSGGSIEAGYITLNWATSGTAVNAIKIFPSSGTITGTATLYGLTP